MNASLIDKIRQKGLRACLRILYKRYIYRHWELLTLERRLDLPTPERASSNHRTLITHIDHSHLPRFDQHFSHYRIALSRLLDQGLYGTICCDEQGNAIGMMWVSERDYYDDQLYHCWVRLPPDCIYQFAGELAKPYRGSGLALSLQRAVWQQYQQRGFQRTRALVDTRNHTALQMHIRLGFEEIGETVHVYRLFGFLHYNRTAPYHQPRLLHLHRKKPLVACPPTPPSTQQEPA